MSVFVFIVVEWRENILSEDSFWYGGRVDLF